MRPMRHDFHFYVTLEALFSGSQHAFVDLQGLDYLSLHKNVVASGCQLDAHVYFWRLFLAGPKRCWSMCQHIPSGKLT